ncbi:MAG: hypothetical protein D6742_01505, partial [Cyanobacteria bacterium J069]
LALELSFSQTRGIFGLKIRICLVRECRFLAFSGHPKEISYLNVQFSVGRLDVSKRVARGQTLVWPPSNR